MNLIIDRNVTKAMMPTQDFAYISDKGLKEVGDTIDNSIINTAIDDVDMIMSYVIKEMPDDGTPGVVFLRKGCPFMDLLDGCLEVYGITIHEIVAI